VVKAQPLKNLLSFLRLGSPGSKGAAQSAAMGAGLSGAVGLLTGGPVEALAYGAGDFLINYPILRATRKVFKPTPKQILDKKTNKYVEAPGDPHFVENIVNVGASLGASQLIGSMLPQRVESVQPDAQQFLAQQAQQVIPQVESQAAQNTQQMIQRSRVNSLPLGSLDVAPNTMYQTQGIEHTAFHYPGLTLPPELLAQLQEQGMT